MRFERSHISMSLLRWSRRCFEDGQQPAAAAAAHRGTLLRAGATAELLFAAIALIIAATSGAPGVSHGTSATPHGAFGPAIIDAIASALAVATGIQNAMARKLAIPT
jgi:hypothetical protein